MRFSEFTAFSQVSGTDYQLDETVTWDVGRKGSGWKLTLDKGYVFNISVPKYLGWIVNPHNQKILLAAAIHDKLTEDGFDIAFSSAEFRRAAIARGYNVIGAWSLFASTFLYLSLRQVFKIQQYEGEL